MKGTFMQKKNILLGAIIALLAAATVSSTCVAVRLNNRLNKLENDHLEMKVAGSVPNPNTLTPSHPNARTSPSPTPHHAQTQTVAKTEYHEMKVLAASTLDDDDREVKLELSERPDMEVVRQYVSVEPLASGTLAFRQGEGWNSRLGKSVPTLSVVGDFAHRTNVTLRVRKGFPTAGVTASSNVVVNALLQDYTYSFVRKDRKPSLEFPHTGRYLPPMGNRSLLLEGVNIQNVRTDILRIPSANVVHFLSLDERAYDHIYARRMWWDKNESFAEDLAGEAWTVTNRLQNVLNTAEKFAVSLVPPTGIASNGVFLVSAVSADERTGFEGVSDAWHYHTDVSDTKVLRVVCVTDLGLSVRSVGSDLGVWVTSLTKGQPVPGAQVELYTKANVLVAKGVTDAKGWCSPARIDKGEAFAVVVRSADGSDMTFLALTNVIDEEEPSSDGSDYLAENECEAFVWTDRGIYRHDEKIFFQAIFRNGKGVAPKPFPVSVELKNPFNRVSDKKTMMMDADGVLSDDSFSVPADQMSGTWHLVVCTPGKESVCLGRRDIKIEEFAPPQVRVQVKASENLRPQEFAFDLLAEHLYGGPAKTLRCDGAVVFADAPFEPEGWKGFLFGDAERSLKPNFRRLPKMRLDDKGACRFVAPIWSDSGLPRAAVKVTAQGTVFEDGGRPATARKSVVAHYYPYYIGATLDGWLRRPAAGFPKVELACVMPDGKRLAEAKRLEVKITRIDSCYSYKRDSRGWATWHCDRVRVPVVDEMSIRTRADGNTTLTLPIEKCGDYIVTVTDPETEVSFGRQFYLSDWGDESVRAPMSNPSVVAISADKPSYRVGETPRLVVKSPFSGAALLTVTRDRLVYQEVLTLTNATSEVVLRPIEQDWAPNVQVHLSVIQSVEANAKRLAVRAHGDATISVRPIEREIPVTVAAEIAGRGANGQGTKLIVDFVAPGARQATVTVVDEGINLLTGEPLPCPSEWLARPRGWVDRLYDLYGRILPVLGEDVLKVGGVKTGGGAGEELLGRVSPVATRRFKPLSRYESSVPVTDGKGRVTFDLPEFVGEVRVTVVACSAGATGSEKLQKKISPKLISQPDAPRFVAPGDSFEVSLPLTNRSGADGEVEYVIDGQAGTVRLADGEGTVIRRTLTAPKLPGEMKIAYCAKGFDEVHEETIELPVRPAVPWRETAGVVALKPGEVWNPGPTSAFCRVTATLVDSPLAELRSALAWLADYPHGCLEQTTSRIFPLVTAGDILATQSSAAASNRAEYVSAGIARVASMVRERDFVMWPDVNYAPWDREVSLYAAHFLVEAEKNGFAAPAKAKRNVMEFLGRWAHSLCARESAYACHTLALAGVPDRDRMFRLYDNRASLDLLSRARVARAFARIGDRRRAGELLANAETPSSVKEASFLMLALLDLDPFDARIPGLVTYLLSHRDKARLAWGTTEENAHALLALGAYYAHHSPQDGETKFLCWRKLELPDQETAVDEQSQLSVERRYLTAEGAPADLTKLARGDLLVVELTVRSTEERNLADLVIEDLFAGALEPVHSPIDASLYPFFHKGMHDWVLRSDARDDRMIVFSKQFHVDKNGEVKFCYPIRVVSSGSFALPQVAAEAMYMPQLRARTGAGRLVVRD